MWSLVTWMGNSLTCLTWQFFWWQVFFQKCKFFQKWLYKHQDLFLKWIRDSGCLPPESCTHPRWSKMSPVCIIGTSDEPLCVPAWPPLFFYFACPEDRGHHSACQMEFQVKWSGLWDPKGHFIFKRSNYVDGKKANSLVYVFFLSGKAVAFSSRRYLKTTAAR